MHFFYNVVYYNCSKEKEKNWRNSLKGFQIANWLFLNPRNRPSSELSDYWQNVRWLNGTAILRPNSSTRTKRGEGSHLQFKRFRQPQVHGVKKNRNRLVWPDEKNFKSAVPRTHSFDCVPVGVCARADFSQPGPKIFQKSSSKIHKSKSLNLCNLHKSHNS